MGIVARGNEDVNVTGVVGGDGPVGSDRDSDNNQPEERVHTGVTHLGRGSVWISKR
jgi:hypothetical protein